jgi:ribosomal protein S6--L-glutamate ligase
VKLGIVMMRHPPTRLSPIMPGVVELLIEWGAEVETIYPEERVTGLSTLDVRNDLYVLKSGSELGLSLGGALHAAGAATLNPYPVAAMCRDKVIATRILQRAGIPTPETYATAQPGELAPLLDDGPLVVKPYRGTQGRGVHVVWDSDQLDGLSIGDGLIFAQRYHEPDGRDRKIYCIGGHIFGVKRVWPARTYADKLGQPFTITPELRDIALGCGRAFGIEVYGLDVIESGGRPIVVDISIFPGFKGVPDAALRLADYIYAAGRRVLSGEPAIPAAAPNAEGELIA